MITRKLVPDFVYDKKSAAVEIHPTLHRDRSFGVSELEAEAADFDRISSGWGNWRCGGKLVLILINLLGQIFHPSPG